MRTRIYLSLFILCCIFSEGINFLSKENNDVSANLHVRKKRVLDKIPGGDKPVSLEKVPYIVDIMKNNFHQCAGSILSSNIIITAAHCVILHANYHVLSGSAYESRGIPHNITGANAYPGFDLEQGKHDLILLTIYPFINFHRSPNRPIQLHENCELSLDTVGTVSGWGSNTEPPNHSFPGYLRSITLPLIPRRMCQQYYSNSVIIDEKKFCTLDLCDQKGCGPGDSGNPFVAGGLLVGIHSGSMKMINNRFPEVYMNLCDREYNHWIHAQMALHPPREDAEHRPLNMNGRSQLQYHPANQHHFHNNKN